jgi:hypothetical protein
MGSQDTSGFAVEIDLWCFLLSSTSAKMRWEAVTRRDDVTWWDVWPIAHNCVASGEMITSTADCQRRKMDRHVRAWTFIFISTWVCSLESFVTEDGLRVYNIQLCIFLFVTSKSKETLWLCVLDWDSSRTQRDDVSNWRHAPRQIENVNQPDSASLFYIITGRRVAPLPCI